MKKPRVSFIIFPILFGICVVYLLTKPPTILWVDSGTMLGAANSLGIPNPPGFPLYMMVAHLFTKIPFGNVLFRLELLSIIFAIAILFLVYHIIVMLLRYDFFFYKQGKVANGKNHTISNLAGVFGVVSLAFSYQFWSQAQNTEAFIFTYFFITLFCYVLLRLSLWQKENEKTKQEIQQAIFTKTIFILTFIYGIAAGANPTVAAFLPAVLFFLYLYRRFFNEKKIFLLLGTMVVGVVLVYAYLPLRAMAYPFVNWGNPQTPALFFGHLHGEGLNIYEPESGSINGFTGSPLVFIQSVSYYFLQSLLQFTPFLFPFIIIGLITVFRKNKYLFFFLLAAPLFNIVYSGLYYSGNQESWFITSWIFAGIFMGIGFASVLQKLLEKSKKAYLLLALSFLPCVIYFGVLNRSAHYYSLDYGVNLYKSLGENALLIGTGDFFNSLGNYFHEADIYRRDVTPVTANMFYVNKWYRDNLRRATNLVISKRHEDIIQYKSFGEYNEAMNMLIADNIDKRPVYVTPLTLRASALAATSAGQLRLDKRFKFIPHGLVLQVIKAQEDAAPSKEAYDFQFKTPLAKTPIYLERNYKTGYKDLLNEYVFAYEALGDWYLDQGYEQQPLEYYMKAYQLNPQNPELLAHLGEYYARKKNDHYAASQFFEKALRLSPKNIGIHFNLGLSYFNQGRLADARDTFLMIQKGLPPGDPIAQEAGEMAQKTQQQPLLDPKLAKETASWQEIHDKKTNARFLIPQSYTYTKDQANNLFVITNNLFGRYTLTIEFTGHKLEQGETEKAWQGKSPILMQGGKVDTQQFALQGYMGKLEIYVAQGGNSSQRVTLQKDNWVWEFKVYPGGSANFGEFYKILNTFRAF